MEKKRGIGGRKPEPVTFVDVTYNDHEYVVGIIQKRDSDLRVPFIIDKEDKERVLTRHWHSAVRDTYISSCFVSDEDGSKKSLYLHNFIMNKTDFLGKGATSSIDHINGIGTDNRKENLREVCQSMQNFNTKQRERKTDKLPLSIDAADIPRNIWYIPPNGGHAERFAVEIKGIPEIGDILWKTSSSKKLTIKEKLAQAIEKRKELFDTYPILKEYERSSERSLQLKKEFEEIITMALDFIPESST